MAVSNGNGNGAVSHLDRLLSEKPPEFQAKVLRFALDSGMKQDDPAFRLVQYIGYLAQLTETAPNDWKLLFENLQDELNQWSQLTAEQLKTQADHTENIKNLATSCNQLGTALSALNLTSQQQLKQLTSLTKLSENLNNISPRQPETLSQPLQEQLNEIQEKISLLNQKDAESVVKGWGRAIMIWLFSPISFFILFWFYSHLTPIPTPIETTESLQKILQNTDWSNAKLQRVEKKLGTDPNQRRQR
ncbi:TM1812 family CRISPR-associated protein [Nostoc sp. LEGE 12447]|uniref:TM1812 family CRISPR-associated protein n=2 Tax=Nostoc TaxID=1177 RepID=UPI001883893B|nr:TM1812 family CRISPR-associated protein [Nostoc sp. LEGE 12447]MBE9002744.1 TM1812 family CRISPR-associated protein [Nostoc sp. LEGE 12447]